MVVIVHAELMHFKTPHIHSILSFYRKQVGEMASEWTVGKCTEQLLLSSRSPSMYYQAHEFLNDVAYGLEQRVWPSQDSSRLSSKRT
jgi:hypothetical protein